jgi:hypothetical protein
VWEIGWYRCERLQGIGGKMGRWEDRKIERREEERREEERREEERREEERREEERRETYSHNRPSPQIRSP